MNRRGFTLIETLIYVALFASSIAVLSSVFISSLRTDKLTEQQHELLQARRLIEIRLREAVQQADTIVTPSTGTTSTLSVSGAAFTTGAQTFTLSNGSLTYQNGSASAVAVTPDSLEVSAFEITRIASTPPGVGISFTIATTDQQIPQSFDADFSVFLRYE